MRILNIGASFLLIIYNQNKAKKKESTTMKIFCNALLQKFHTKSIHMRHISHLGSILQNADGDNKLGIVDQTCRFTYAELQSRSNNVAQAVARRLKSGNQNQVGVLCSNSASYVSAQVGIWKSGHVSVPLCHDHPVHAIEYYLEDSVTKLVVASKLFKEKVRNRDYNYRIIA